MDIVCSRRDDISMLTLKGKLDLGSAGKVKEHVRSLLNDQRRMIHFDMTGVDFINSSGLGALVSMMKEIRVHQGRLTLSNLAPYVKEIFEITQLSNVFDIFPTVDEALSHTRAPATQ